MRKGLLLSSIMLAITSSLCCIVPLISIIGGMSGLVSSVSWVQPFRPYLIVITIITLGIAFYQAYKPSKADTCGCVADKKTILQSKGLVWSITILSLVLMSFPYLQQKGQKHRNNVQVAVGNTVMASFNVSGMTCKACESHVNNALLSAQGVLTASSDHETGLVSITFDKTKAALPDIMAKVETETGYKTSQ